MRTVAMTEIENPISIAHIPFEGVQIIATRQQAFQAAKKFVSENLPLLADDRDLEIVILSDPQNNQFYGVLEKTYD